MTRRLVRRKTALVRMDVSLKETLKSTYPDKKFPDILDLLFNSSAVRAEVFLRKPFSIENISSGKKKVSKK